MAAPVDDSVEQNLKMVTKKIGALKVDCSNLGSTVVRCKLCTQKPKKDCNACRKLLALSRYDAKRRDDSVASSCSKIENLKKKTISLAIETPPDELKEQAEFTCACVTCGKLANIHCTVCADFNICVLCYRPESHAHKMVVQGLNGVWCEFDERRFQKAEKIAKEEHYVCTLVHAATCQNLNCTTSCKKMKRMVSHSNVCKKKPNEKCLLCKQLSALCVSHSKRCKESKCPKPFCSHIKRKLEKQAKKQQPDQVPMEEDVLSGAGVVD